MTITDIHLKLVAITCTMEEVMESGVSGSAGTCQLVTNALRELTDKVEIDARKELKEKLNVKNTTTNFRETN